MSNLGKTISKCPACSAPLPEYRRNVYTISHHFPQPDSAFTSEEERREFSKPLDAARIRRILRNMTDEAVRAVGMCPKRSRPEWLVWTCMLVPPPCIRPSVMVSAGTQSKGEDFLTIKLQEIVKQNRAIGRMLANGQPPALAELSVSN